MEQEHEVLQSVLNEPPTSEEVSRVEGTSAEQCDTTIHPAVSSESSGNGGSRNPVEVQGGPGSIEDQCTQNVPESMDSGNIVVSVDKVNEEVKDNSIDSIDRDSMVPREVDPDVPEAIITCAEDGQESYRERETPTISTAAEDTISKETETLSLSNLSTHLQGSDSLPTTDVVILSEECKEGSNFLSSKEHGSEISVQEGIKSEQEYTESATQKDDDTVIDKLSSEELATHSTVMDALITNQSDNVPCIESAEVTCSKAFDIKGNCAVKDGQPVELLPVVTTSSPSQEDYSNISEVRTGHDVPISEDSLGDIPMDTNSVDNPNGESVTTNRLDPSIGMDPVSMGDKQYSEESQSPVCVHTEEHSSESELAEPILPVEGADIDLTEEQEISTITSTVEEGKQCEIEHIQHSGLAQTSSVGTGAVVDTSTLFEDKESAEYVTSTFTGIEQMSSVSNVTTMEIGPEADERVAQMDIGEKSDDDSGHMPVRSSMGERQSSQLTAEDNIISIQQLPQSTLIEEAMDVTTEEPMEVTESINQISSSEISAEEPKVLTEVASIGLEESDKHSGEQKLSGSDITSLNLEKSQKCNLEVEKVNTVMEGLGGSVEDIEQSDVFTASSGSGEEVSRVVVGDCGEERIPEEMPEIESDVDVQVKEDQPEQCNESQELHASPPALAGNENIEILVTEKQPSEVDEDDSRSSKEETEQTIYPVQPIPEIQEQHSHVDDTLDKEVSILEPTSTEGQTSYFDTTSGHLNADRPCEELATHPLQEISQPLSTVESVTPAKNDQPLQTDLVDASQSQEILSLEIAVADNVGSISSVNDVEMDEDDTAKDMVIDLPDDIQPADEDTGNEMDVLLDEVPKEIVQNLRGDGTAECSQSIEDTSDNGRSNADSNVVKDIEEHLDSQTELSTTYQEPHQSTLNLDEKISEVAEQQDGVSRSDDNITSAQMQFSFGTSSKSDDSTKAGDAEVAVSSSTEGNPVCKEISTDLNTVEENEGVVAPVTYVSSESSEENVSLEGDEMLKMTGDSVSSILEESGEGTNSKVIDTDKATTCLQEMVKDNITEECQVLPSLQNIPFSIDACESTKATVEEVPVKECPESNSDDIDIREEEIKGSGNITDETEGESSTAVIVDGDILATNDFQDTILVGVTEDESNTHQEEDEVPTADEKRPKVYDPNDHNEIVVHATVEEEDGVLDMKEPETSYIVRQIGEQPNKAMDEDTADVSCDENKSSAGIESVGSIAEETEKEHSHTCSVEGNESGKGIEATDAMTTDVSKSHIDDTAMIGTDNKDASVSSGINESARSNACEVREDVTVTSSSDIGMDISDAGALVASQSNEAEVIALESDNVNQSIDVMHRKMSDEQIMSEESGEVRAVTGESVIGQDEICDTSDDRSMETSDAAAADLTPPPNNNVHDETSDVSNKELQNVSSHFATTSDPADLDSNIRAIGIELEKDNNTCDDRVVDGYLVNVDESASLSTTAVPDNTLKESSEEIPSGSTIGVVSRNVGPDEVGTGQPLEESDEAMEIDEATEIDEEYAEPKTSTEESGAEALASDSSVLKKATEIISDEHRHLDSTGEVEEVFGGQSEDNGSRGKPEVIGEALECKDMLEESDKPIQEALLMESSDSSVVEPVIPPDGHLDDMDTVTTESVPESLIESSVAEEAGDDRQVVLEKQSIADESSHIDQNSASSSSQITVEEETDNQISIKKILQDQTNDSKNSPEDVVQVEAQTLKTEIPISPAEQNQSDKNEELDTCTASKKRENEMKEDQKHTTSKVEEDSEEQKSESIGSATPIEESIQRVRKEMEKMSEVIIQASAHLAEKNWEEVIEIPESSRCEGGEMNESDEKEIQGEASREVVTPEMSLSSLPNEETHRSTLGDHHTKPKDQAITSDVSIPGEASQGVDDSSDDEEPVYIKRKTEQVSLASALASAKGDDDSDQDDGNLMIDEEAAGESDVILVDDSKTFKEIKDSSPEEESIPKTTPDDVTLKVGNGSTIEISGVPTQKPENDKKTDAKCSSVEEKDPQQILGQLAVTAQPADEDTANMILQEILKMSETIGEGVVAIPVTTPEGEILKVPLTVDQTGVSTSIASVDDVAKPNDREAQVVSDKSEISPEGMPDISSEALPDIPPEAMPDLTMRDISSETADVAEVNGGGAQTEDTSDYHLQSQDNFDEAEALALESEASQTTPITEARKAKKRIFSKTCRTGKCSCKYCLEERKAKRAKQTPAEVTPDENSKAKRKPIATSKFKKLAITFAPTVEKIKCSSCTLDFENEKDMQAHFESTHVNPPKLCSICRQSFQNEELMKLHELSHQKSGMFLCLMCDRSYKRKADIVRHCNTHKDKIPSPVKRKSSAEVIVLDDDPIDSKPAQPVKMRKLSVAFTGKVERVESTVGSQEVKREIEMKAPLNSVHSKVPSTVPPKDTSKVPSKDPSKVPTKVLMLCSICQESFQSEGAVKKHESTHERGGRFWCLLCDKSYKRRTDVVNHYSTHKGQKVKVEQIKVESSSGQEKPKASSSPASGPSQLKQTPVKVKQENLFSCKLCGKEFVHEDLLEEHKKIHTGAFPFPCSMCDKAFKQANQLKKHERVHTGDKPYMCQYCNKRFYSSSNKRRHERTHTGYKPYVCRICDKPLSEKWILKKHEKMHLSIGGISFDD